MKRESAKGVWIPAALMAMLVSLAACGGSGNTEPVKTQDAAARASYAKIVKAANTILFGDALNYLGTSDGVERVRTRCRGDRCSIGLVRTVKTSDFSAEDVDLEFPGKHRGVSMVKEVFRNAAVDSITYGGWLDHSFFSTQATLFIGADDPRSGATGTYNYSVGYSTGAIPRLVDGSARWEGLMLGRDTRVHPSRGGVVKGDATVTVDFGAHGVEADVAFTNIVDLDNTNPRSDMIWKNLKMTDGGFGHRAAPDDYLSGRFYGPKEQEVGGIFERNSVAGAFGGVRADQ